MSFQFSLIRFVPDPARGEFVNIGAVAGSDEAREWELRLVSNLSRAKALDDRGVLSNAFAYAAGLEDHIAALDQLPETSGAERRASQTHEVPAEAVRERAPVRSGAFDGVFDFAVHNARTIQLVQCWSFQLPNQADLAEQVKAWSWLVHEVRQDGGELTTTERGLDVPAELDIFAIAIPPVPGAGSPAYEEANAAFVENGVIELSPEEADRLGEHAAHTLAATA